jgi:S1-C subfamily serine protease
MTDNPWSAPSGPADRWDPDATRQYPPVDGRNPWSDPVPSHAPPPAPAPPLRPVPRPGGTTRAALAGGIVGALVAAGVAFVTVRLTDDGPAPAVAPAATARAGVATTPAPTSSAATAPGAPTSAAPVGAAASGGPLTVKQILERVSPSVVSIELELRRGQAAGSGVIISADGLVLTNAHVVDGATALSVRFSDGSMRDADLVGAAASKDVALIHIRDASGLAAAALGSSAQLSVGDDVIAIGNALDLGDAPTVTRGIVSAKDRSLDTGEAVLGNLIQTDAAINHGNSGGPLLNTVGEVVGINTAGIENASNLGFAIEIDAIKPIIDQLKDGGAAAAPAVAYLGVQSLDPDELDAQTASDLGIPTGATGAIIYSVVPNSPAAQAGLRAGDLVISADGKAVSGKDDVRTAIQAHDPGDTLTLHVVRDGRTITITATLGSRSSN